jgi:hypothetical protein
MANKTTPKRTTTLLCLYLAEPISISLPPPKGKREEGRGKREEKKPSLSVGREITTEQQDFDEAEKIKAKTQDS